MAKLKYGFPGLTRVLTRVGSSEVHGFSQAPIYVMCVQSSHTPEQLSLLNWNQWGSILNDYVYLDCTWECGSMASA